jgi:hypothetical protein
VTPRERDEFERINITAEMERARYLVAQYEEHQEHFRNRIERHQYRLGKLDERLGG